MDSERKVLFDKNASVNYMERKLKRKGKNSAYIANYIGGWLKVKHYKKEK